MKKSTLLLMGLLMTMSSFAQTKSLSKEQTKLFAHTAADKIQRVAGTLATSIDCEVPNNEFDLWESDSIESMFGGMTYYRRPFMWTPINGFIISFFTGEPMSLDSTYNNITQEKGAQLKIGAQGFGCDLATLITCTNKIAEVNGRYEFNGAPNVATIEVYASKFNVAADSSEVIGQGVLSIDQNTSGLTNFSVPIDYFTNEIPDSVYIFFNYLQGDSLTYFNFDQIVTSLITTGVESKENKAFSVYPNPAKDVLKITYSTEIKNANWNIYNITGKLIKQELATEILKEINIADLPTGIYFLQMKNQDNIYTQKFIKE